MIDFTINKTSTASIDVVFDRLTDHAGIADITPVRKSTLEKQGQPDANGVGAVRRLELVGPPIREEITEYSKPDSFAYKLLSGLPVKDHVGTVKLTARPDGGTEVNYHVRSTPTIPGGAVVLKPVLKKAITDMVTGALKAAERAT